MILAGALGDRAGRFAARFPAIARAAFERPRDAPTGFFKEQVWTFAPQERSPLPGSPASPDHPTGRRILYGLIGVLIGLTGGMGNALVSVNLPYLEGALGLYANEIAWLPAVYAMTNVVSSMVLIKYRQQFGLRSFALIFVSLYCAITFGHVFVRSFAAAIAVRAASGVAAAALTNLCLYYVMQAFPARWRQKAIVVGIAVPQLAIPIARLFSSDLLAIDQWRALYLFEFGLALISLAAVALVRLPPSQKGKAFEPLDAVTIVLFAGAMALVCAVLGLGRYDWWTDRDWIGWALAGSMPLLAGVFLIEYHRANPLIDMRWLGTIDFLRFAVVGVIARIVLSEQTYGSVGLLAALGFTNDQLYIFSLLIVLASVAGIVVSATLISPTRLTEPVMFAIGLVAVGSYFDSFATNLTRAPEMYLSQMLIAFSTTLFIGPALLIGFTRVLAHGGKTLTSFIVLFGMTQSLGGLIGTATLGTYQVIREKQHSFEIVQRLTMIDPNVVNRVQQSGAAYARVIGDPSLRTAEGLALLSQQATREANVLAFNDVFWLVSVLAAATTVMLILIRLHRGPVDRPIKSDPPHKSVPA